MAAFAESLSVAIQASFQQNMSQIERCVALLGDERAWERPNDHCNSVANLLLHLNGNLTQWALHGLARQAPAQRNRPSEFAARGPAPVAPLVAQLRATVDQTCRIIAGLSSDDLAAEFDIQGYHVTGAAAAYHVGEHFSFHAGQIVHITKAILDVDLSLYDPHGRRLAASDSPW